MKVKQLLNELTHIETPPSRRLMIGKLLNQLGDTRQGIGLDKEGLPDIDWVAIPSGKFTYQENQKKVSKQFFLSRYPVTNAQFRAFVDSRGYEVSSAFEGFLSPKEADQWWLDLEKKSTPPDHKWTDDNRPCENISWYDAVAFCRWLSTKKGYEIRLPKEQEWEKGARGSNGREYPWGDHYKTGIANINERYEEASEDIKNVGDYYLEETTAVGVYPHGQSPYGLMDVSGNIWEWCLNNSHSPEMTTLDKSAKSRTLRGGAWSLNSQFARTTNRSSGSSIKRESFVGFRLLAISLINAKNDNGGAIKTSKDERTSKSDSGKKEELDSAYYKNQSVVKSTSKDNLEKSTTRKTKDKKNKQEKKYINNLSEKPEKNIAKRVLLLLLIVLGVIFGLFYLNNSYHEVPDYYSSDNSNSLNNTVSACDFCSLTVYSDPGDARIRIMNIKRKYKLGIILPRGYYRIRVDRPGYVTYNEELYIKNEKPIYITLDRKW